MRSIAPTLIDSLAGGTDIDFYVGAPDQSRADLEKRLDSKILSASTICDSLPRGSTITGEGGACHRGADMEKQCLRHPPTIDGC
jgi:hypothetical protein